MIKNDYTSINRKDTHMVPENIFNSKIYRNRVSLFTYSNNIVKISLSSLHNQILSSGDLILLKDETFVISNQTIYQYDYLRKSIFAYSPYTHKHIMIDATNIIGIVQKEDTNDYTMLTQIAPICNQIDKN